MSTKLKRDLDAMEQRRREGMRLLAQGFSQAEVARRCGISRVSARRWEHQRRSAARSAWRRRPLGRRPKLNSGHVQKLKKTLLQGAQAHGFLNDRWTLPRLAELIHRQTGVRMHPGHVWRLLGRLGWNLQRPAGKATQRDEAGIARWKKQTWPAPRKSP